MSWLFPGFLAGAALIGLPVLLHLLRRRPREVVRFPSLRFLGESAVRDTRRSQLRRWLTLLLRCLALALLCAAFARPYWGTPATATHRALVIALDNSMSQQTTGRWSQTQRWSQQQLNALSPGDQAALLIMEPEPVWLVPLTEDLARVRSALATASPGYYSTRYARPLRMAAETLANVPAQTKILAWAADEQRAGWRGTDLAQTLPPGVNFRFLDILPAPLRQAAVVGLHSIDTPTNGLAVTIRQYQSATNQRTLTVYAGQTAIATQTVALAAGDNHFTIPCPWPKEAPGLRVTLDPDDLPADDTAWIAATTTATNVLLMDASPETDFLAHALRATQKVAGTPCAAAPLPGQAWPAESAVILRDEASFREPALTRLNQFCAAGGAVWIFVDGSAAQKVWLQQHGIRITPRPASTEPWHLRDWDTGHPALAAFAQQNLLPLLEVEFYGGFDLAGETLAPIANWPDGRPALAELDAGSQRLLITGFPLNREATDWPTRPSFVPFIHGAARWLGAFKETHNDWRVGDTISLPPGEGRWHPLDIPVPGHDQIVNGSVRPEMPGLYEFAGGGVKKTFAVNTPLEESDLAPWPNASELAALESAAPAPNRRQTAALLPSAWTKAENRQRLWWWLLLAGGCALLAELALANRTSP